MDPSLNNKASSPTEIQQLIKTWLSYLIVLLLVVITGLTWGNDQDELQLRIIIIGVISLLAFIATSILIKGPNSPHRPGPSASILLILWMTTGLDKALVVTLLGPILCLGYHYFFYTILLSYQPRPHQSGQSFAEYSKDSLHTIVILGPALVVTNIIYTSFGGLIPITHSNLITSPIIISVILGTATAYLIEDYLTGKNRSWFRAGRDIFIQDWIFPLISIPVATIYHEEHFGLVEVLLTQIIILYLMIRSIQLYSTQNDLASRVEELSSLSSIVEDISSTLEPQQVIEKTYEWVRTYAQASYFYVAIFDEEKTFINFPLVMQNDQRQHKIAEPFESNLWVKTISQQRNLKVVHRNESSELASFFDDLPNTSQYQYVIGIPLNVGTMSLGVMTIVATANRFPHFETLRDSQSSHQPSS